MSRNGDEILSLYEAQYEVKRIWTTGTNYSPAFLKATEALPVLPFAHAVDHVVSAAGKLLKAVDGVMHGKYGSLRQAADIEPLIADLVICAAKLANEAGHPIDLDNIVRDRLKDIEAQDRVRGLV